RAPRSRPRRHLLQSRSPAAYWQTRRWRCSSSEESTIVIRAAKVALVAAVALFASLVNPTITANADRQTDVRLWPIADDLRIHAEWPLRVKSVDPHRELARPLSVEKRTDI